MAKHPSRGEFNGVLAYFLHNYRWGAVSVIFGLILVVYGMIRAGLWIRGQVRYCIARRSLPKSPLPLAAPEHLAPPLKKYFERGQELKIKLAEHHRMISIVLLTDPDVPLGTVRDSRYRRCIIDSYEALSEWLDQTRELCRSYSLELEALGSAPQLIEKTMNELYPLWRLVRYSRALEPFSVADVAHSERLLLSVSQLMQTIEFGLSQVHGLSYRGVIQNRLLSSA